MRPTDRRRALFAILWLAPLTAAAVPTDLPSDLLAGAWQGAFQRGGSSQAISLRLAVEGGSLSGEADVPALGMFGEPVLVSLEGDGSLAVRLIYGSFRLRLSPERLELRGRNEWEQPMELLLERTVEACSLRRREIRFRSGAAELAGTLVLPERPGPHPAAVVVHGAGPRDRGRWTYRSRGDALARLGIAALVFDQRGRGASGGSADGLSFEDLARDVGAALDALASQPEIDAGRLGLDGASQGGWIALLASRGRTDVRFLLMRGTPAVSVWDAEVHATAARMEAKGFSAAEVEAAITQVRSTFAMARGELGVADYVARSREIADQEWAEYVDYGESESEAREIARDWLLERYDPGPDLGAFAAPVLAVYGGLDTAAPPRYSEPVLEKLAAGGKDVSVRIVPGVPHNLERRAAWVSSDTYIFPRRDPRYDLIVSAWLERRGIGARPPEQRASLGAASRSPSAGARPEAGG